MMYDKSNVHTLRQGRASGASLVVEAPGEISSSSLTMGDFGVGFRYCS